MTYKNIKKTSVAGCAILPCHLFSRQSRCTRDNNKRVSVIMLEEAIGQTQLANLMSSYGSVSDLKPQTVYILLIRLSIF